MVQFRTMKNDFQILDNSIIQSISQNKKFLFVESLYDCIFSVDSIKKYALKRKILITL